MDPWASEMCSGIETPEQLPADWHEQLELEQEIHDRVWGESISSLHEPTD